ncbi:MAG: rRNA pseudouridine synthase [Deferribacteres bacterium]|nr:rRNA pseudouridine synthase [Deferribacteres bacterium]
MTRKTWTTQKKETNKPEMTQQAKIRLNKFLAQANLGSRRSVETLVTSGFVQVNNQVITSPGYLIDPQNDTVIYDGNVIRQDIELTYAMLNKPVDYICSRSDEKKRATVYSLVRLPQRLFTVGRLDKDSEGLLLFTNDGEFANRLIHPRYKVEKKYNVVLQKPAPADCVEKFRHGVVIDKKFRVTANLYFPIPKNRKVAVVTIEEGRNRQIRKMFAVVGARVKYLQRFQIDTLKLGSLAPGAWRYLTNKELVALKKAVELDHGTKQ